MGSGSSTAQAPVTSTPAVRAAQGNFIGSTESDTPVLGAPAQAEATDPGLAAYIRSATAVSTDTITLGVGYYNGDYVDLRVVDNDESNDGGIQLGELEPPDLSAALSSEQIAELNAALKELPTKPVGSIQMNNSFTITPNLWNLSTGQIATAQDRTIDAGESVELHVPGLLAHHLDAINKHEANGNRVDIMAAWKKMKGISMFAQEFKNSLAGLIDDDNSAIPEPIRQLFNTKKVGILYDKAKKVFKIAKGLKIVDKGREIFSTVLDGLNRVVAFANTIIPFGIEVPELQAPVQVISQVIGLVSQYAGLIVDFFHGHADTFVRSMNNALAPIPDGLPGKRLGQTLLTGLFNMFNRIGQDDLINIIKQSGRGNIALTVRGQKWYAPLENVGMFETFVKMVAAGTMPVEHAWVKAYEDAAFDNHHTAPVPITGMLNPNKRASTVGAWMGAYDETIAMNDHGEYDVPGRWEWARPFDLLAAIATSNAVGDIGAVPENDYGVIPTVFGVWSGADFGLAQRGDSVIVRFNLTVHWPSVPATYSGAELRLGLCSPDGTTIVPTGMKPITIRVSPKGSGAEHRASHTIDLKAPLGLCMTNGLALGIPGGTIDVPFIAPSLAFSLYRVEGTRGAREGIPINSRDVGNGDAELTITGAQVFINVKSRGARLGPHLHDLGPASIMKRHELVSAKEHHLYGTGYSNNPGLPFALTTLAKREAEEHQAVDRILATSGLSYAGRSVGQLAPFGERFSSAHPFFASIALNRASALQAFTQEGGAHYVEDEAQRAIIKTKIYEKARGLFQIRRKQYADLMNYAFLTLSHLSLQWGVETIGMTEVSALVGVAPRVTNNLPSCPRVFAIPNATQDACGVIPPPVRFAARSDEAIDPQEWLNFEDEIDGATPPKSLLPVVIKRKTPNPLAFSDDEEESVEDDYYNFDYEDVDGLTEEELMNLKGEARLMKAVKKWPLSHPDNKELGRPADQMIATIYDSAETKEELDRRMERLEKTKPATLAMTMVGNTAALKVGELVFPAEGRVATLKAFFEGTLNPETALAPARPDQAEDMVDWDEGVINITESEAVFFASLRPIRRQATVRYPSRQALVSEIERFNALLTEQGADSTDGRITKADPHAHLKIVPGKHVIVTGATPKCTMVSCEKLAAMMALGNENKQRKEAPVPVPRTTPFLPLGTNWGALTATRSNPVYNDESAPLELEPQDSWDTMNDQFFEGSR